MDFTDVSGCLYVFIIDKYRDSCPKLFTDSDRETGVYKEYCHPEKEVYCEVSNRSEQTLPEVRYPQQTNAQQEDVGEDTGDKETTNADKKGDDDVTEKVNTKSTFE